MDEKDRSLPPQRPRGVLWRWRDYAILSTLALLPLAVFWPAALLRGVFYVHDVQYYFYPYHALPAALLAHGELPLWNPYAFGGLPLLGDGQTALFYPPSWLFFLLPGGAALSYDVIVQFSIAGMGMYLFGRGLGLWRVPALVGALAFMFCGFLTARVVHLSILSGAALIPLVFLCFERAIPLADAQGPQVKAQAPKWATGERSRAALVVRPWSFVQGRRWFAAMAGAVGLQALAGHPQIPVYTAVALGLYALVRAAERHCATGDARWLLGLPLMLAGVYGLGYALAAIQLVPWIELGSQSPRAAGASFDFVFSGSTVGGDWLLPLFPYLYGAIHPGRYTTQPVDVATSVRIWEHSVYVGILPLALAAYALPGLFRRPATRNQARRDKAEHTVFGLWSFAAGRTRAFTLLYFGLLLALALLLAAGKHTPLAGLIYLAPVVGKLRDVERAMALADFALAALAALGMQRLAEAAGARLARSSGRPSLLIIAAATALLPLAVVVLARRPWFQQALLLPSPAIDNLGLGRPNAAIPLALALLSAALLLWWSRRPATPLTQALAVGLVLLDIGSYAAAFNPLAEPRLYERRPEVLAAFQNAAEPFRKATFLPSNDLDNLTAQETLAVSWGMVYGVEDINGFNSLQPRRYTDYVFGPQVGDVSYGMLRDERLLRPESPILSALNVKYLLVPGSQHPRIGAHFRQVYQNARVRVYENTLAYPRAFFAETVRGETDPNTILRAVTADGFDGRRLALVETDRPPTLPSPAAPAQVTIGQIGASRIALETSAAAPRFLVLSEMYMPGWRAYIDGAETPIYRTNYLFRGVVAPAGRHTITFEYRPASIAIGAAISLTTLISMLFVAAYRARRHPTV